MKTPVVWLTEENRTTFIETLRRAELLERDDLFVLFRNDVLGLPWPEVVAGAVAKCKETGARLLIVDTISQFVGFRGDSENNAGDALAAIEPLQEAAATGIGVIVVRHERKGGGDISQAGRGSTAFAGAVDVLLALHRPDGNTRPTLRVLHAVSRFDGVPESLMIELCAEGYVSRGECTSIATQDAKQAILAALPKSEEKAITFKALQDELPDEIKRTTAQEGLQKLIEEGKANRKSAGKKKDPYLYWAAK